MVTATITSFESGQMQDCTWVEVASERSYHMGNAELQEVNKEINLGTIMDRELSFQKHCQFRLTRPTKHLG